MNRPLSLHPLLITLGLLLFLSLAGCRDRTPHLTSLDPDAVILAFGDSLTSGYGASSTASYPAILENLTGYRTVNAGRPGELSTEGLKRLPKLLQRYQPDLVILCHGGNDLLRRHDSTLTATNLRRMIEAVQSSEAEVVLLGVPQPGLWLRAAPFYQEIADEYGIPYNNKILPEILSSRELKSDAIHPNAAGYRQLAETLAQLIGRAEHN